MDLANIYEQMAIKIIAVQEAIIGPLAIEQARGVVGLKVSDDGKSIVIDGDGKQVVQYLIESYRDLFGISSVEVSKDAVLNLAHMLQPDQVPEMLLA